MMRLRHEVTDAQLAAVLFNLSPEDAAELKAAGITEPTTSFLRGLALSTIQGTVLLDEVPVCVFGCTPDPNLEGAGIPWMIATPDFRADHRKAMEFSKLVIAHMQGAYGYLHNWVHREHEVAIRWLQWLGFSMGETPVGPGGQFFHFERSRNV